MHQPKKRVICQDIQVATNCLQEASGVSIHGMNDQRDFFCGQYLLRCTTCDGFCGPTNGNIVLFFTCILGCQCFACYLLTLQQQQEKNEIQKYHQLLMNGDVKALGKTKAIFSGDSYYHEFPFTPLTIAVYAGKIESVKFCLQNKLIQEHDSDALHLACEAGHANIVTYLIAKGFKVNAVANSTRWRNRTPLHYAAWRGREDIVRILLSCNANVHIKDTENGTAYDYALVHNHDSLAVLFYLRFDFYRKKLPPKELLPLLHAVIHAREHRTRALTQLLNKKIWTDVIVRFDCAKQ